MRSLVLAALTGLLAFASQSPQPAHACHEDPRNPPELPLAYLTGELTPSELEALRTYCPHLYEGYLAQFGGRPAQPAQPSQPAQPAPTQPQQPAQTAQTGGDDAERRLLGALAGPGRGLSQELLERLLSPADRTAALQAAQRGGAAFQQRAGVPQQPNQQQQAALNAVASASAFAAMTDRNGHALFPSLGNARMMQVITLLSLKAAGGDQGALTTVSNLITLLARQDAARLPAQ